MHKSLPTPFTLFLAILSLWLALIFFTLGLLFMALPRPFQIHHSSFIGLLFLLYPAHNLEKYNEYSEKLKSGSKEDMERFMNFARAGVLKKRS